MRLLLICRLPPLHVHLQDRAGNWCKQQHLRSYTPLINTGMLLFEPRAGFGCDCLHVAAASPPPECHGDPCQTGSLAESSNTVLVLLILGNASCFKPQGVITSLQSPILMGRNSLVIPTLLGRPTSTKMSRYLNGAFRMCRLSALLLCVLSSLIHPDLRDTP